MKPETVRNSASFPLIPMKTSLLKSLFKASVGGLGAAATMLPAQAADYPTTVQSFNPVGYWRLNETTPVPPNTATNSGTLKAAANGDYQAGALHPATTSALVGSADTAANFPNAGRVVIPWNAAMNPPGAFTVECWANSAYAAGGNHTLVQSMVQGQNAANGDDRSGWNLREVGADLQFLVGTSLGAPFYYIYTAAGVVYPGTWQHIVVVYDGTSPSIFVDGVLIAGVTVTRDDNVELTPDEIAAIRVVPNLLGPTIIGDRGYGGWNFDGDIDEVAIYASTLNATEVSTHYQNGTSPLPSPPYDQLVGAKSPPAYYRLNEPAYVPPVAANLGSLAAQADGAYGANTVPGSPGPPALGLGAGNHACLFTGSGDINCGTSTGFDLNAISISAWIKVNAWDKTWQAIVTKGDGSWRLHRAGNSDAVGFGTSGLDNVDLAGTRAVNDGIWHHIVAIYDGSTKYLYVDGALDVSVAASGTISANSYAMLIGENSQATGRFFNGLIDEVAIFDTALTAEQVTQLFEAAQLQPQPIFLTFGLPGFPAGISGNTITWTVPSAMDVTTLAPEYTVSAGSTGAPASGTPANFTTPQVYTVFAGLVTNVYTVQVVRSSRIFFASMVEVAASSYYDVGYEAVNLFNGNGLSADGNTHGTSGGWWSSDGSAPPSDQWVKVRFDKSYPLDYLRVWNYNEGGYEAEDVQSADVYVINSDVDPGNNTDNNGLPFDPTGWTRVLANQTFVIAPGGPETNTDAHISLGGVTARQLALKINSNYSTPDDPWVGLSEVQIYPRVVAPPTPTLPLSGFTLNPPSFANIPTVTGSTYWLTCKDSLGAAGWTRLVSKPGTGGNITLTDPTPANQLPAQRFYRLEVTTP